MALIIIGKSVQEVKIGIQIDIFAAVEWSSSEDLETQTDTSGQSNLKR